MNLISRTACLSLIVALLVDRASSQPTFDKKRFCNCRLTDEDDKLPVVTTQNITFPFIVSLGKLRFSLKFFTEKHKMETHLCSGVILNPDFILTSASCVSTYKNEFKKVGVGLNNKKNDLIAIYDEGRIPIKSTILHPEFDPVTLVNDIALVQLTKSISFDASRFRPICLLDKIWYNKMKLLAWGQVHNLERGIDSSDIKYLRYLKESHLIDISYIVKDCYTRPTRLCMRSIDRTDANHTLWKNENGSPLFNQEDNMITIAGLFSYYSYNSSARNISQSIGVYTKVASYLQFIKDHLSDDFCFF